MNDLTKEIDEKIKNLEEFINKHQSIFEEYKKLRKELEQFIFQRTCLKEHLKECETLHCAFYKKDCYFHVYLARIPSPF